MNADLIMKVIFSGLALLYAYISRGPNHTPLLNLLSKIKSKVMK